MKKIFISIFIIFLSFSSIGLLGTQKVLASDGGTGKFMLKAFAGPKSGEVTLTWIDAGSADNYHLVYGTDSKTMQFGALDIGTNNVYTVGKLNPGTKYYFALVPVMNNTAMYTTALVSAVPTGGQSLVQQAAKNTISHVPAASAGAKAVGSQGLWGKTGPASGDVTLYWRHTDDANNYHLVYGTKPGIYTYGALNIGWVNSYTVHKLNPGATYYFALVPVKNDTALYTTSSVQVAPESSVQVVKTTAEAVRQPKASVSPIVAPSTSAAAPSTTNATVNETVNITVDNTGTNPLTPETTSGQ